MALKDPAQAAQLAKLLGKPGGNRRQHKPGEMNKTEAEYAQRLEEQRLMGVIQWWGFEKIKLKLADRTFYTPDFAVLPVEGPMQFHEVKGFWEDDARVKFKVAREQFPCFAFHAWAKRKGVWVPA